MKAKKQILKCGALALLIMGTGVAFTQNVIHKADDVVIAKADSTSYHLTDYDCDHSHEGWTAVASVDDFSALGTTNVYLTDNILIDAAVFRSKIYDQFGTDEERTVCLNGHSITVNGYANPSPTAYKKKISFVDSRMHGGSFFFNTTGYTYFCFRQSNVVFANLGITIGDNAFLNIENSTFKTVSCDFYYYGSTDKSREALEGNAETNFELYDTSFYYWKSPFSFPGNVTMKGGKISNCTYGVKIETTNSVGNYSFEGTTFKDCDAGVYREWSAGTSLVLKNLTFDNVTECLHRGYVSDSFKLIGTFKFLNMDSDDKLFMALTYGPELDLTEYTGGVLKFNISSINQNISTEFASEEAAKAVLPYIKNLSSVSIPAVVGNRIKLLAAMKINFDVDGVISSASALQGTEVNLSTYAPKKARYEFLGWKDLNDYSGAEINYGPNAVITADRTYNLKAVFQALPCQFSGTEITGTGTASDPVVSTLSASTVLVAGDVYLNTTTFNMYRYNGTEWKYLSCIKGQNGTNGVDGQNGTNGTNGADGQNGTNGADGADGKDGSVILYGSVDPTATLGKEGDLYINTTTFDLFSKTSTGWVKVGNIKGAAGSNGTNGSDGTNGTNGTDGKNGADGKDGKDGVDGKNGVDGKDGINGTNGADGKDGTNLLLPLILSVCINVAVLGGAVYILFAKGIIGNKKEKENK